MVSEKARPLALPTKKAPTSTPHHISSNSAFRPLWSDKISAHINAAGSTNRAKGQT
jgi:hypothetical protein